MRGHRIAILLLLVFWVLLGPVGIALSGCIMMEGCDALCGVSPSSPIQGTALASPLPISGLVPDASHALPRNIWSVLDSPPKFALLAL